MQFYVRNNIFRIKPELCKDIFTGQNSIVFLHIMRHLSLFDTERTPSSNQLSRKK